MRSVAWGARFLRLADQYFATFHHFAIDRGQ